MIGKCIKMLIVLVVVWSVWGIWVNGLEPQVATDIALEQMNDNSSAHVNMRTYSGFANTLRNPMWPFAVSVVGGLVVFRKEVKGGIDALKNASS